MSAAERERTVLIIFLVLAVLGAATAALLLRTQQGNTEESASLPRLRTWRPSEADVARQRALDAAARADFLLASQDEALLRWLSDFHQVEMEAAGDPLHEAFRRAAEAYRLRVERYVRDYGLDRYVRLGLEAAARYFSALEALSADARVRGGTLAGAVVHQPDKVEVRQLRDLGGGFIDWAIRAELYDLSGRTDPARGFLSETLYKVRWLQWAQAIAPVDARITRFEKRTVLAYQIEEQAGLPVERRLDLLDELLTLQPDYPGEVVRLILLTRAGRVRQAAVALGDLDRRGLTHPLLPRIRQAIEMRLRAEAARGPVLR